MRNEEELDERLSRPPEALVRELGGLKGDLVLLGAAGKMGPTLARMARRALPRERQVVAVARFSDARARTALEAAGMRCLPCDLLDRAAVDRLPDAAAVLFMAGQKFGTTGGEASTWAQNTVAPANCAERYKGVPTVVFSTGNVYPLTPVSSRGATEETPPGPVGEYAQSALGRERVFQYFSEKYGTPVCVYRLNYAVECRYGVLIDLAQKILAGEPIDLRMGHVNVIWQGDANAAALRCIPLAAAPRALLNVTGPQVLAVRDLASRLGELLGRPPVLQGQEEPTALLSDASKMVKLFGPPTVGVDQAVAWVAAWLRAGGRLLGKATHFETRDGKF
ncbi:MAG TPA: NAD(P)-dependent oxidoreductase [Planctomycetota bacterium]|nr:NAD(P)-dependent oxidoreductase [Planctomycetota bacterium]